MEEKYIVENGRVWKTMKTSKSFSKVYVGSEFKTSLEWDELNQEVVARYENYLGELQEDFNGNVTFTVGDSSIEYKASSGICTCPISGESGTYEVEVSVEGAERAVLEVTI